MSGNSLPESFSAILICMAVSSMLFTIYIVARNNHGFSFMVTILLMLIVSAVVRVVERFQFTEYFVESTEHKYGAVIGMEISVTWGCLLLAEWLIAMKYFDMSSQLPAVINGSKSIHEINPSGSSVIKLIGGISNVLVSVWPGVLFAATYYKKKDEDVSSIFWEF